MGETAQGVPCGCSSTQPALGSITGPRPPWASVQAAHRPPPAPVLEGRQPRLSSETPPASARGQGRPHPSPHVRCRRRQGFP